MSCVAQARQSHRRAAEGITLAEESVEVVEHGVDILLCLRIALNDDIRLPEFVPSLVVSAEDPFVSLQQLIDGESLRLVACIRHDIGSDDRPHKTEMQRIASRHVAGELHGMPAHTPIVAVDDRVRCADSLLTGEHKRRGGSQLMSSSRGQSRGSHQAVRWILLGERVGFVVDV